MLANAKAGFLCGFFADGGFGEFFDALGILAWDLKWYSYKSKSIDTLERIKKQ